MWTRALAAYDGDLHAEHRARLRTTLQACKTNCDLVAADISNDLPTFTLHDSSHTDELWLLADTIAGEQYNLTPTEALVFGAAILFHDLAMTQTAFPEDLTEYLPALRWRDLIYQHFMQEIGRKPTQNEIQSPPNSVAIRAKQDFLRSDHAQQSEQLPMRQFGTSEDPIYLLPDRELREQYGELIGKIAASHWWSEKKLAKEFDFLVGQPSGYPRSWIVDPLKIACLLRVADISHIDATRAPSFLHRIRKIDGDSAIHWTFQENIRSPILENDRLTYTATRRFRIDEAESWWLCVETLRNIDETLRAVDNLLADKQKDRFAAKSVAFADDIRMLSKQIPTDGWYPIDARIKVNDVISLVKRLGGQELYGNNPKVALRELVTNSADAIRARQICDPSADDINLRVRVELKRSGGKVTLVVDDNGVGMTLEVLTDSLLDFGRSYWSTNSARNDLPGLLSSGFCPTGRYGIGFFSVFMLGKKVSVISRRFDTGYADTHVLEFTDGLDARPLARKATANEVLGIGGTRISVELDDLAANVFALYDSQKLADECARLFPTLDIQLQVGTPEEGFIVSVRPNDWETLSPSGLRDRLARDPARLESLLFSESNLSNLYDGEKIVGRLSLLVRHGDIADVEAADVTYMDTGSVITVGGASSNTSIRGAVGVLLGEPMRAARDTATPIVSDEELARWASDQASLVYALKPSIAEQLRCSAWLASVGGNPGPLVVAQSRIGAMTVEGIEYWASSQDEIIILQDASLFLSSRDLGISVDEAMSMLNHNVLVADCGSPVVFAARRPHNGLVGHPRQHLSRTLDHICQGAIARGWQCSERKIYSLSRAQSKISDEYSRMRRKASTRDDDPHHPLRRVVGLLPSGDEWYLNADIYRKSDALNESN
ncbi:ATP-binding protein [Nocardia sp. CDC153]|uniref:HD domain-containing protein n=1 Tax=Nocardia sp. CDC153 TaxID=3112167 RepID=UPI002DB767A1|nr:ATP-binding protein [Nocardia sp. CDC153]MEC3957122.1 ATP-binding protein [Nocardia sp. CDC153]